MMDKLSDEEVSDALTTRTVPGRPSPDNFDVFLPWACAQLRVETDVFIVSVLSKCPSKRTARKSKIAIGRSKYKQITRTEESDQGSAKGAVAVNLEEPLGENVVKIYTTYDNIGNLLQLKFDKNKYIPPQILKIIGLVLKYHIYLTGLTVNKGINNAFVYELSKLLTLSNITDICLDNTAIPGGNYDLLLTSKTKLAHLSISRCSIDDIIVEKIASNLEHPSPASKTLQLLNLATNFITDAGATHLAKALRNNRRLVYLNLADNSITDEGSVEILKVLCEFQLEHDEITESRSRYLQFMKEKDELIQTLIKEQRSLEFDKKASKRRSLKTSSGGANSSRKNDKELTPKLQEDTKSSTNLDAVWLEKAKSIAKNRLGEFFDPFSETEINSIDNHKYCYGNNTLAYLNLSYNNISYVTLKKILAVLKYQKSLNRKPRGLVNVNIEGNSIPKECVDLTEIDDILLSYVVGFQKRLTIVRRKI